MVPGVSGGTVALVFGIYTELVAQIRQGARALGQLARGRVSGFVTELRRIDWWFLLPLLHWCQTPCFVQWQLECKVQNWWLKEHKSIHRLLLLLRREILVPWWFLIKIGY